MDDGWYPDWYLQNQPSWKRAIWWFFRNPFHNFTFYVIGFCDHPSVSYGKSPEDVFVDGWNYGYTKVFGVPWPFISYQGKSWKWYAGWRMPGAAFGFKFRRI